MKKWLVVILFSAYPLFGDIAHEPKIDQICWVKGWLSNDLYIRTNNHMWWKIISFETAKPSQWEIGDGVIFSKDPFENPCQYWLININHFGGVIAEYQYELPICFKEQE